MGQMLGRGVHQSRDTKGFLQAPELGEAWNRLSLCSPQKEPSYDTLSSALWPPGSARTPVTEAPFWGALFQWPLAQPAHLEHALCWACCINGRQACR